MCATAWQRFRCGGFGSLHEGARWQSVEETEIKQPNLALEVVIANHCLLCREALKVANVLRREFPALIGAGD